MKGRPTTFWGKLRKDAAGEVVEWHPLIDHCADVAACCECLLRDTILGRRLATMAGLERLSGSQVARFAALAALHDVGKFNIGFQNKALMRPPFTHGHVAEVLALFDSFGPEKQRLIDALRAHEIATWGVDEAALELLLAAIGHHGRPVSPDERSPQSTPWRRTGELDPFLGIGDLARQVRAWFPEAFAESADALPSAQPLQHAFAGLVMLADWLGSDTRFFTYSEDGATDRISFARERARFAVERIGLDPRHGRASLPALVAPFARVAEFSPNGIQRQVAALPCAEAGEVMILEAETGSGKTEAALARFLRLFELGTVDGLYFALPTRTSATQMFARVRRAVERAFPDSECRPPVILAVPGYLAVDDVTGQALPPFSVLWNDDPDERFRYRGWAAEHPKRFLAGCIVVGTVDQVLLSSLMVGHAHMRSTALLRHLLVVDEVHASDAYMTATLCEALRNHCAAGGAVLLMSATLGTKARARLVSAVTGAPLVLEPIAGAMNRAFPVVTHVIAGTERSFPSSASETSKDVRFEVRAEASDAAAVAGFAVEAAARGARALVIRNTVADCIDTQICVESAADERGLSSLPFRVGSVRAPHHSRFSKEDREALDRQLDASLGKASASGGLVVVATQTVQQSLDVDADLLITDLCPMDVLLQRIGRLHRHPRARPEGFARARTVVLVPGARDLTPVIDARGHGRGKHGFGTVYEDLRVLEATWRLLESRQDIRIPRDNRELVELATHPDALGAIVTSLGESWARHATHMAGVEASERRLAELNAIDRRTPYYECRFPSGLLDRRIQTRLGEGDRLAIFAEELAGAFATPLRRLTIPAHLARGVPPDAEPTAVAVSGGTLRFSLGERRFDYDRLGLRAHVERGGQEDTADE